MVSRGKPPVVRMDVEIAGYLRLRGCCYGRRILRRGGSCIWGEEMEGWCVEAWRGGGRLGGLVVGLD